MTDGILPNTDTKYEINTDKKAVVKTSKARNSSLAMRKQLWPLVTDDMLWLRSERKGFTTIPRTMPLFMELIHEMSKRVTGSKSIPAGKSYLVLWCRVFDDAFVKVDVETVAAKEAGYSGERNVSTWREHLRVLQELGFIKYEAGPAGPCNFVLLLNPYQAVLALKEKGWLDKASEIALFQRAQEIGADDLDIDN